VGVRSGEKEVRCFRHSLRVGPGEHILGITTRQRPCPCRFVRLSHEVLRIDISSGFVVDRLNHGIDLAKAISIGLIVALRIVVGARDVVRINAATIAYVLEGF